MLSKHHKYTAFLDIDMPPRLQSFVAATPYRRNILSLQMGLQVPMAILTHLDKKTLPGPFEDQGLHSSFLVNFWEQLTSLCIVICAAVIFSILDVAAQKSGWSLFTSIFRIFKLMTTWNFLLILFSIDLDDIIYYSYIEFKTVQKGNFLDSFSLVLAIFMFCMAWAYLIGVLVFIWRMKNPEIRITRLDSKVEEEGCQHKLEGNFQIIYAGFKNAKFGARLFYFIYALRYVLSAMMGAYWYFGRSGQAILQMFLGLFILMVVLKERPFKRRINLVQVVVIEVILLLTNIFTIIVVNSAVSDQVNSAACVFFADLMIIGDILINFLMGLFLAAKLILEAFSIYKLRQKSPHIPGTVWLQLLALILQQGGFGFEEIYISEALTTKASNKVHPIKNLADEKSTGILFSRELTRVDSQFKKPPTLIIDSSALLKELSPKDRRLSGSPGSPRKNGWRNSTIQSPNPLLSPSLASIALTLSEVKSKNEKTTETTTHGPRNRLVTVNEDKNVLIDLNWEPRSTLTRLHDGELSAAKDRITERLNKRHKIFGNFDLEMETSEVESGPNSPTSPFKKAFQQINEQPLRFSGGL